MQQTEFVWILNEVINPPICIDFSSDELSVLRIHLIRSFLILTGIPVRSSMALRKQAEESRLLFKQWKNLDL